MSVKTVDCRGMACPQPVIETKKALETGQGIFEAIVDNEAARENVSHFARNAGCRVEVEEKEGCYHLFITGSAGGVPTPGSHQEETYTPEAGAGQVYFITTNTLGQGSPDLGAVLMKSLMVTLAEQQVPPAALLFLNTGVFLTAEGSPVLEQLQKIAGAGTEILVCGTCLDYYKQKEKLAVGVVSNMYDINARLTGPHKVITVG